SRSSTLSLDQTLLSSNNSTVACPEDLITSNEIKTLADPRDKPEDDVSVIGSICDSIKGMILFRVRGVAVRPKT
ncbi:hypothetical protein, partial [Agrobacterium sp. SUL3]|uniref:hypothetical protein n=1 Tax=Agrobacterium sp. SUL3 TaxID=1701910 RepID=UPI001AEBFEC6